MLNMDRDKINREAKELLDKFASALDKAGVKDEGGFVDREGFERVEGKRGFESKDSRGDSSDFKKRVLENAPESKDDFIIVEKGDWK
jgi:hypothetical protein